MPFSRSFDKSNLFDVLTDFPNQFREGIEAARNIEVKNRFGNVIICGMGGSALAADVLKSYIPFTEIPIHVSRDYNLPLEASEDSLIICISFSGNTEETLSAFMEGLHVHCKMICITAGGKLKDLCYQNNVPAVLIPREPPGIQPRHAMGYVFGALVKILSNCGVIPQKDDEILEMARSIKTFNFHEQASQIAKRLYKKIPVVYSSEKNKGVARVWKIKFNETSKVMAFHNTLPELNHNEMVGHTNSKLQGNFHTIMLRDKTDHPKVIKRMKLLANIIKSRGEEFTFVDLLNSEDLLTKIFTAILFGDWISYYLAGEYRVDPTPVEIVEEFKKRLELEADDK